MYRFKQALALSKEEVREATPPGTSHLIDNELVRTPSRRHVEETQHIHLVPEPSSDPADPLNWPMWRKVVILTIMGLYAIISNLQSSILSSVLPELVTAFATFHPHGPPTGLIPFGDLSHLIAVNSLMLGASAVFWVPFANTFGRRPVILINLLIIVGGSIWSGKANSFHSLLAARVIQGAGGGAADAVCSVVLGEIFFVHQRGRAMAIYTMCLVLGSPGGGLIGGYVTASYGWRWTMYIPAIISAVLFVLAFFFMPETFYERDPTDTMAQSDQSIDDSEKGGIEVSKVEMAPRRAYTPFTFGRSLKMGMYRSGLLNRFWTPYKTLRLPGTWMVMFHYGGLVGLIVTCSTAGPQLLAQPPYKWGAHAGLINVGGIIGGMFGMLYTYFSADWWVKRSAKRESHGTAEAETRLPLMLPCLLISTMAPLVFGLSAANPSEHGWVGLCVGLGMVSFGIMQVGSVGFNYLLDAYGGLASDCFLCVTVTRSLLGFIWTFVINSWLQKDGAAQVFGVFTLLMGLFSLTIFPVWLWGKRLRIATADWVGPEYANVD